MSKKKEFSEHNNTLKRQPNENQIEEENSELISSKKKPLLSLNSKTSKKKSDDHEQKIDYEESFRRHLLKEAELQKNIELFHKNIGEKILYDQNFSESLNFL